jgi:phage gp36-like protein
MPDYLALSNLNGQIPPQFLIQSLDDNNDGVVDAWEQVKAAVQDEVDSLLEGRFAVPLTFDPMPRKIRVACVALACELCYRRRGTPDAENPWKSRADAARKQLAAVTAGDLKLAVSPPAEAAAVDPPGAVIVFDSALGAPGRLLG